MGNRCPSRLARSNGTSRSEQAAIVPGHPLLPTGFSLPQVLGTAAGSASALPPFLTKLSSFLSPLENSLRESAAQTIAAGRSGLPHRFLARAAVSNGRSDTDQTCRDARPWLRSSCGGGLGVLVGASIDGRSCTRGIVRSRAAPPVPVPRLRNGLGVMGLSLKSAGAPRLLRLWWCDRAGLPVAPFTVLLLGIATLSLFGVVGMDTVGAPFT
jgi:hypothetical protein